MDEWADIFGAAGPLASGVEGFAPRVAQQRMAERVAAALRERRGLAVEAGTGIGKTFAYLVPALLSGQRVVISTGTRNLQDQLHGRDLPTVCGALGRPVQVALLKGRANYLCRYRLEAARGGDRRSLGRGGGAALARIGDWARVTDTGDIAEVSDVDERSPVWPQVTSTVDNCLGTQCPEYARCHVVRARRRAQEAQVVIVNHHLLLADMALKEEGFGELLPGADAVIVDEAHQLADTAMQFFGVAVSGRAIANLVRDLRLEAQRGGGGAALEARVDALLLASREFRIALGPGSGRLDWEAVGERALQRLEAVAEALTELAEALEPLAEATAGLARAARRTDALGARLERIAAADAEAGLRWLDVSAQGYTLHLTPYDVSDRLESVMEAQQCTWVFTSATLAVGDSFTHFTERLGLGELDSCVLPSPFDYPTQGLMYLPEGLPAPSSPEYTTAVVEAALPLLAASGGRAFLLFTSHRALEQARDALLARTADYTLLVQGEAPRQELLRRFVTEPRAVLLGTASFWEGVDVRGDALRLVVIDRLPFASPSDPLLKARLESVQREGGDAFRRVQLPQAVIALKQGVGRLIRDTRDRGVVMLCDPRLSGRGYGRVFLHALPAFSRTRREADALAFLQDAAQEPAVCA